MAVDIEGNCRFYDLVRFKKIAKLPATNVKGQDSQSVLQYRVLMDNCVSMMQDSFFAVVQDQKIFRNETSSQTEKTSPTPTPDPKSKTPATQEDPVEQLTEDYTSEGALLKEGTFSGDKKNLKSVDQIASQAQTSNFYL